MRICVSAKHLKTAAAMASLLVAASALSGCSTFGSSAFGDRTTTGSVGASAPANLGQPMPSNLGAPVQVASSEFLPPANVGGFNGGPAAISPSATPLLPAQGQAGTVTTGALPPIGSTPSLGTPPAMPAQSNLAPLPVNSSTPVVAPQPQQHQAAPQLAVVPAGSGGATTAGGYTHTIQSGESLYTIARRYDVTTQALVQANGLSSPDRITVGQRITIPGRPDLARTQQTATVTGDAATQSPVVSPAATQPQAAAPITESQLESDAEPAPQVASATQPVQQATPLQDPETSGAANFRWPVSGRVITDFAASRGTGINIEAPEGASIRAAENGTVIYVGSGVEGYGNLILIRHSNGYVSAYAHLKDMSVTKGSTVNRGDAIGTAGMTGSVSRPQLHFELRRGATPVDPMPLLAT